jgi:hypothetical protein
MEAFEAFANRERSETIGLEFHQQMHLPHPLYPQPSISPSSQRALISKSNSRKSLTSYLIASVPEKTHVFFFFNLPRFAQKMRFKIMCFNSYAFLAITFSGNYL